MRLPFRAPLDWSSLLGFLAPRAIPEVEAVDASSYSRTLLVGASCARVRVACERDAPSLGMIAWVSRAGRLPEIARRVRRLLDLDCDPGAVSAHFRGDEIVGPLAAKRPGLRVPGTCDGFELAARAVLGQQVTVKGATTLAGRLVRAYGTRTKRGRCFPHPERLVRARFRGVGLTRARAETLRRLASACADGEIELDRGTGAAPAKARLREIPGIGEWTSEYVAMRALADPDAFPSGDLGLRKAAAAAAGVERMTPGELRELSESWRPWRAYAAMHLWTEAAARCDL